VISSKVRIVVALTVRTRAKLAKAAVTTFGAALTSLNVAPQLEAAIVDLSGNFDPTSVSLGSSDDIEFISALAGPDFYQYNGSTTSSAKIMSAYYSTSNIVGFNLKNFGELISSLQSFDSTVSFSYDHDSDEILGFLTADGRVGWIEVDTGGDTEMVYLGAAWNDAVGGTILAGTLTVPEPTTAALAGLAALALGASGVRRRRKRRAEQSESA
jgi:hypothetical protein